VDTDFWFDFGDSRGGDVIDLTAELNHHGDRGAAIRELARITGVTDSNPRPDGWREYTQNLCNQIAFWQTQLTSDDYDYLHSRGLTDDTIRDLKIGRTNDGRLSIPYMKNGYVAYYCTRYLPGGSYPDSKYRKQKRDDYNENIPWGLETLSRSHDTLVIAEGAFDAISFYQDGYPVLSAITGFFSRSQIPTVLSVARKFKRVFIVYDDDSQTSNAGQKFTMRMAELLTQHRIPFVVGTVPKPYHDVSEYYAAGGNLESLIIGAEPGLTYIATRFQAFDDLEKFIFSIARHTKRSQIDELFTQLRSLGRWNEKSLTALYKSCTSAPPETIIADEIMHEHNLVYLHAVGFYEYDHGVWNHINDGIINGYADRAYGEFSTANRVSAITKLLKTRALRDIDFNKLPVWNFINGTLELDTGVFRDHNPNDYCSFQADYPYNPDATYSAWTRFIDDVTAGDPVKAEILQFIPAYVLMPHCKFEKIFCLTGSGGNGKSKYLDILRKLFGNSNVSNIKPLGLIKDFQRIALKDSLLNIAGEIKSDLSGVEEAMKEIASGETISACYKGEQYVSFAPRAKLIFAMNNQLKSGDTSDGLTRRLVIVDFLVSFVDFPDSNNPYEKLKDVDIIDRLTDELNSGGIFNWVYNGYKLLSTVGYFTETHDQQSLIEDFKRASNPIRVFWDDCYDDSDQTEILYDQVYADYIKWCSEVGERVESSQKFHSELKKIVKNRYDSGVRSVRIDGKPRKQRYYYRT
jgi:P4 family phage/plasmid primase-like protien